MYRHRFDPISFVFGGLFTALAVIGLTDALHLRLTDLRWLGPTLLVLVGVLLVLTAGRGNSAERAAGDPDDTGAVDAGVDPAGGDGTEPATVASADPDDEP